MYIARAYIRAIVIGNYQSLDRISSTTSVTLARNAIRGALMYVNREYLTSMSMFSNPKKPDSHNEYSFEKGLTELVYQVPVEDITNIKFNDADDTDDTADTIDDSKLKDSKDKQATLPTGSIVPTCPVPASNATNMPRKEENRLDMSMYVQTRPRSLFMLALERKLRNKYQQLVPNRHHININMEQTETQPWITFTLKSANRSASRHQACSLNPYKDLPVQLWTTMLNRMLGQSGTLLTFTDSIIAGKSCNEMCGATIASCSTVQQATGSTDKKEEQQAPPLTVDAEALLTALAGNNFAHWWFEHCLPNAKESKAGFESKKTCTLNAKEIKCIERLVPIRLSCGCMHESSTTSKIYKNSVSTNSTTSY